MDIIPQLIVNSIIAGAIYSMVALGGEIYAEGNPKEIIEKGILEKVFWGRARICLIKSNQKPPLWRLLCFREEVEGKSI